MSENEKKVFDQDVNQEELNKVTGGDEDQHPHECTKFHYKRKKENCTSNHDQCSHMPYYDPCGRGVG